MNMAVWGIRTSLRDSSNVNGKIVPKEGMDQCMRVHIYSCWCTAVMDQRISMSGWLKQLAKRLSWIQHKQLSYVWRSIAVQQSKGRGSWIWSCPWVNAFFSAFLISYVIPCVSSLALVFPAYPFSSFVRSSICVLMNTLMYLSHFMHIFPLSFWHVLYFWFDLLLSCLSLT